MTQRKAAEEKTRQRILVSARKLLFEKDFSGFSMEAVARAANVSRLTVYYQFESKAGLLEALYNDIARRGGMATLGEVFRRGNDPLTLLHEFIRVFVHFWASERDVIRRLHGIGALDAVIGNGLRERNERRRKGLSVILESFFRRRGEYTMLQDQNTIDTLHMLTSFETYDALAGKDRSEEEVVQVLIKMVHSAIGFFPRSIGPR